jgi:hypothetical protein
VYRKNTAGQFVCFQGVDATTGGIKSGVTWTVRRCIDGTFAAATGTVTEDSTNGWYKFAMSQADTNGNDISFNFTGTGAVPQTVNIITTACDPTTATNFGITALPATAVSTNASLLTSGTGTDQVSVSAGKVLLQATQSGVTIPTVTTVTNQLTAAAIATGIFQDTTAGDFTVANSIGKSIMNGVALGTGLTIVSVSGSVGSVTGAVGSVTGNVGGNVVGSVASVTARVTANTDQLAGQTVTAGAGVTFPASVASPTNITAGTITTVTNLTNAPTAGDFTATMKTSLNAATPASTGSITGDVSGKILGGGVSTITGTGVRAVDGSGNAIAPASTALSTVQWTNARAANLDNLDAAISTRTKPADTQAAVTLVTTTTNLTNAPTAGDFTATMKSSLNAATPASTGSITGDVSGKVLGGGAGTITGTGVRAVDGSGNAIAPASTALSTAQWTNGRAANLDNLDAAVSTRLATSGYTAPDNTDIVWTRNYLEGDRSIDTGVTPWAEVVTIKQTVTELVRKKLRSTAGVNITSSDVVIGSAKDL